MLDELPSAGAHAYEEEVEQEVRKYGLHGVNGQSNSGCPASRGALWIEEIDQVVQPNGGR